MRSVFDRIIELRSNPVVFGKPAFFELYNELSQLEVRAKLHGRWSHPDEI